MNDAKVNGLGPARRNRFGGKIKRGSRWTSALGENKLQDGFQREEIDSLADAYQPPKAFIRQLLTNPQPKDFKRRATKARSSY